MGTKSICILVLLLLCSPGLKAQEELLSLIQESNDTEIIAAAFKGTHIINGHSTKTKNKGEFDFLIYHRFGPVNSGIYELFGLDEANMRIGFEYGIIDALDVGIGRSTYNKTYDGYVKWKFLQQKKGSQNFPLSMVWYSSMAIPTVRIIEDLSTVERIGYVHELLLSRKFNSNLTIQLVPGLSHQNTAPNPDEPNDIFYTGIAVRYKITPSVALTGEYYYRFNEYQSIRTYDPFGLGVDIETGGHVFQLHVTNSRPTYEVGFISETLDDFWDGGIRFGFNISRTFSFSKKAY